MLVVKNKTLCDFRLPKFHSCDLIVIVCVPTTRGCHISQHIQYQLRANINTIVQEWRKSNYTVRSYCQKCDSIPQKSIIAVESMCLSITDRNFLFHHCTLARNVVLHTPEYHGWPSTQPGSLHTALQRKFTQPCSLFLRGTAVWTMGARLCEQWGKAVCKCPAV